MKKKNILLLLLSVSILAAAGYYLYYKNNPLVPKLSIRNKVFTYEIAITEQQRKQGLSGRDKLPDFHGKLFVFPNKAQHGFWMYQMKFDLDFIWIDDTTVVDISENIPAPKQGEKPVELAPKKPVNRVLEVNAGTIQKAGIQIGDTVEYLRR